MPRRSRHKKSKYVTRRALPFLIQRQAEPKYNQSTVAGLDFFASLPEENDLTSITTGTGRGDRIGNQIQVTGVYARGFFSPSHGGETPTDNAYMARVILYTPREQSEVFDVLPGELIDKERFVIWYDRLVPIPWTNQIDGGRFTIKKSFKPYMKVVYDTSVSTSAVKNSLKILISTNSLLNLVTLDYHSTLYFRDL